MCDALPEEVEHRGVNGEAMMLLGPSADPEARGHLEASVMAGRLTLDAIEVSHLKGCEDDRCLGCAGHLHPDYVLGSWDSVWREALDHGEPAGQFELPEALDYLDRTMGYMADFPHVPFEDFATDLRRCAAHIEAVLHDQQQGERANVGCFDCGGDLERRIGKDGFEDFWTCGRCKRRYTSPEYNFALRAAIEAKTKEATA
jgi:ribosomal protein L37AE/L43A